MRRLSIAALLASLTLSGCAVITVADAAVSVAATTVKVGATVVGTAVDVTAAGVKYAVGSDEEEQAKKADKEKAENAEKARQEQARARARDAFSPR